LVRPWAAPASRFFPQWRQRSVLGYGACAAGAGGPGQDPGSRHRVTRREVGDPLPSPAASCERRRRGRGGGTLCGQGSARPRHGCGGFTPRSVGSPGRGNAGLAAKPPGERWWGSWGRRACVCRAGLRPALRCPPRGSPVCGPAAVLGCLGLVTRCGAALGARGASFVVCSPLPSKNPTKPAFSRCLTCHVFLSCKKKKKKKKKKLFKKKMLSELPRVDESSLWFAPSCPVQGLRGPGCVCVCVCVCVTGSSGDSAGGDGGRSRRGA